MITADKKIEKYSQDIDALPLGEKEDLDWLATLAMENLYRHCGERGGRELSHASKWLIKREMGKVSGYRLPDELKLEFQKLCETKWKSLMLYLR